MTDLNVGQYFDRFMCIAGTNEDAGDSAHRCAMWGLGQALLGKNSYSLYIMQLSHIRKSTFPWTWRRTWQPGWYRDYNRWSRDQHTPQLCLMAVLGMKKELWQELLMSVIRLGFYYNWRRNGATASNHGTIYRREISKLNFYEKYVIKFRVPLLPVRKGIRNFNIRFPDIVGPEIIGLYVRGLRLWPLYPLLYVLDLDTLLGAHYWNYRKETDVLNHLCISRTFQKVWPTWVSNKAIEIEPRDKFRAKLKRYSERVGLPLDKWWAPHV